MLTKMYYYSFQIQKYNKKFDSERQNKSKGSKSLEWRGIIKKSYCENPFMRFNCESRRSNNKKKEGRKIKEMQLRKKDPDYVQPFSVILRYWH